MAKESVPNPPWMRLHVHDYLRDTSRLSAEQHGVYLLLILDYWQSGPLPDDNAKLARIARMTPGQWMMARKSVEGFFQIADGEWRHKRIEEEYADAVGRILTKRGNGAKGGRPAKNLQENLQENLPVNLPVNLQPNLSPNTVTVTVKAKSKSGADAPPLTKGSRLPSDWVLPFDWQDDAEQIGLANGSIPFEAAKFRDYWISKSGKDATKTDWRATWRNWCRSAVSRDGKGKASKHDLSGMNYSLGVDSDGRF